MAKWKYVGGGDYLQGLPMEDLDEDELTEAQKGLLETAISMKMYEAAAKPKKETKEIMKDGSEQSTK